MDGPEEFTIVYQVPSICAQINVAPFSNILEKILFHFSQVLWIFA